MGWGAIALLDFGSIEGSTRQRRRRATLLLAPPPSVLESHLRTGAYLSERGAEVAIASLSLSNKHKFFVSNYKVCWRTYEIWPSKSTQDILLSQKCTEGAHWFIMDNNFHFIVI